MLRILFTTQPGAGHLHPLIPVARGLADRGHDVAVAAAASFHGAIEAVGLRPLAAGLDWSTREMAQTFPDAARIPPGPARYAWARATVFAGATARAMAPDVAAIAERWPPDLVVREAAEYGGALGAELLGIPHAVVRSDTGSSSYSERHAVTGSLGETRALLGLPADAGRFDAVPLPAPVLRARGARRTAGHRRADIPPVPPRGVGARRRRAAPAWLDELAPRASDRVRHARHGLQHPGRPVRRHHRGVRRRTRQPRADRRSRAGSGSLQRRPSRRRRQALDPADARCWPTAMPSSPTAASARCPPRSPIAGRSCCCRSPPTSR